MRGAEPVEKVDERNAGCEGCHLRDRRKIVRLLDRRRSEQSESGRTDRHDILMVPEYRKSVGCQRPRSDVKYGGRQLARNAVHVRDHQEKALRCRERRSECATLESTMNGARRTAFALHLDDLRHLAPDVGPSFARPLIRQLRHG
jgi:hypothetical protein